MRERVRMTNADAAWLHMDRQTNLMVIISVMWFDAPVDWSRLRQVLEDRLVSRYPRFSQLAVEPRVPVGGLHWVPDPDFDLERHLVHVTLPEPGDRAALEEYVGGLMGRPLDRRRPLWDAHLVDGYEGGAAVVTRIHHAIADGISLARVLLSLTDNRPEGDLFLAEDVPSDLGRGGLVQRARHVLSGAREAADALVHEGTELLAHPARMVQVADIATKGAKALGKLLLLPPDHRTVFKGRMGEHKLARWSEPIPLEQVKEIGQAIDATVNDVLCTALAGALRTYLQRRDSLVENVRAIVPFNLRPLDEPLPRDLGNQFGLVFLGLPVGIPDRCERLAELKRRMDEIKSSPEGAVAYGVLSLIGLTPVQIERVIVDVFGSKGSLVLTNVPGPRHPVFLAGTRVAGLMPWVPASGGVALGLSIFSYDGSVVVGVRADARLVPDPELLVAAFQDEIEAMYALQVTSGTDDVPAEALGG